MPDQEITEAAQALLELCARKKLTLGLAESCTGGLVAAALTDIPGSSKVLDRGFVTYSNEAKQQIGVAAATLERYGAVSRETAEAMAKGVQHVIASTPEALAALGVSEDHVRRMVEARFGGLLAADPGISIGGTQSVSIQPAG